MWLSTPAWYQPAAVQRWAPLPVGDHGLLLRKLCGGMLLQRWVVSLHPVLHRRPRSTPSFQKLWVPAGLHLPQTLEKPKGTNLWDQPQTSQHCPLPKAPSKLLPSHLKRYRFEEWFWTYWMWVAILACLRAIIRHHRLYDSNSETYFVTILGGWKSKVKILLFPWLEDATFKYPHMGTEGRENSGVFSSHMGTSFIRLGPQLYDLV